MMFPSAKEKKRGKDRVADFEKKKVRGGAGTIRKS